MINDLLFVSGSVYVSFIFSMEVKVWMCGRAWGVRAFGPLRAWTPAVHIAAPLSLTGQAAEHVDQRAVVQQHHALAWLQP
jgi:hypothetical protein